jgi:hypothetical protein
VANGRRLCQTVQCVHGDGRWLSVGSGIRYWIWAVVLLPSLCEHRFLGRHGDFFFNYGRPAQQDDSLTKDRFSSMRIVEDINT